MRIKCILVETVSFLLILLFAYTAISKLGMRSIFEGQLVKFPILNTHAFFFSWGIPLTEAGTALLLMVPKYRIYGLYAAAILLTGFTIFLIFMLIFNPNLPCSCGGVIVLLSWKQHLFFNLFFLFLCLAALLLRTERISRPGTSKQDQKIKV